jgi:hypothetical protein
MRSSYVNLSIPLLILISVNFPDCDTSTFLRIRKVKCTSSMKSIKDQICYIKSNPKDVLWTTSFFLTRNISDAKLRHLLGRISSTKDPDKVIQMFDVKDIAICDIVKKVKASPFPLLGYLVEYIRQFKSNLLDACTEFNLKIELNNFTYKNGFTMSNIFPLGIYFNSMHFYNDFDENIFNLSLTVSNIRDQRKP